MEKPVPAKKRKASKKDSLLERASDIYDFKSALKGGTPPIIPADEPSKVRKPVKPAADTVTVPAVVEAGIANVPVPAGKKAKAVQPFRRTQYNGPITKIDRDVLREVGLIVPDGPVSALLEEFRIVKRQVLLNASSSKGRHEAHDEKRILICSALPNEGKTFCSLNLALSIAAEKDTEVLLVDADFAKPSILSTLGLESSRGLMDALADPSLNVEDLILHTDIAGLTILPAGEQTNNDTEFLASARTEAVLDRLTQENPHRIVIFDSPPALAASPASVLATYVGQAVMVVKADTTTETALRDALNLLAGCEHIQLLLNGVKFSPTGRRFGSYYGYGE